VKRESCSEGELARKKARAADFSRLSLVDATNMPNCTVTMFTVATGLSLVYWTGTLIISSSTRTWPAWSRDGPLVVGFGRSMVVQNDKVDRPLSVRKNKLSNSICTSRHWYHIYGKTFGRVQ
jgi:hypothetical protein